MNFTVTAADIRRVFPGLDIPAEALVERLDLDLGHLQLLRDAHRAWADLQGHAGFWITLLCLVDEVNKGSLCLPLVEAERIIQGLRQAQPTSYHSGSVDEGLRQAQSASYHSESVGEGLEQAQLTGELSNMAWSRLTLRGLPVLCLDGGLLYFEKYHQAERSVAASLQRLIRDSAVSRFPQDAIKAAIDAVCQTVTFDLNEEQLLAMGIAVTQPFSIISGGPGTGKTTILGSVLRSLLRLGVSPEAIALAAPTGKAANRMTESLQQGLLHDVQGALTQPEEQLLSLEAATIHRLLNINPSRPKPRYHENNQWSYQVLVIDEVSMVDMLLMDALLKAIPSDCRVVFLGDQFQLPSVSSGAVLADLMPDANRQLSLSHEQHQNLKQLLPPSAWSVLDAYEITDGSNALLSGCVAVLKQSMRSGGGIVELSECVRVGDAQGFMQHPSLLRKLDGDVGVMWCDQQVMEPHWSSHCQTWLTHHFFKQSDYFGLMNQVKGMDHRRIDALSEVFDAVFQCINQARILTLVNQGLVGADSINHTLAQMFKKKLQSSGQDQAFHGAVIMVKRNDKSLNLYNGDTGVLVETESGQLRAVFPAKSGHVAYSIHVIPDHSLAFAITVHKSQGSEFNHVLMPLPDDPNHRLLSREMLYTGMTRAKTSVQLIGSQAVLQSAIKGKNQRHSGLKLWDGCTNDVN